MNLASVQPDPSLGHRHLAATLLVRHPDGSACADAHVTLEQRRHSFPFGNIGFDFVGLANGEEPGSGRENVFGGAEPGSAARLVDLWLEVFNTATLPFYWAGFEPVRDQPDTDRLLAAAKWFRARGVTVKGHPLVWHTLPPDWLRELPDDEVEEVLRARIRREVGEFGGLIDAWDAINEAVIMPVFDNEERQNAVTRLCLRRGRIGMVRLAFEEARGAHPGVTLVLNDFDMSTAYECLIEGVLEAGIELDAIGLQSHMHQGYWGEEKTLAILDRFARYGLPLHLTETTLLSGDLMPPEIEDLNDYQVPSWPSTPEGEERQADEIVRHYRTLLSHPSVQFVNYWGITDQGSWLGAPAGLVDVHGSAKPAYEALRRLIKQEWWVPPTGLRTDSEGRVSVRGWAGEYTVSGAGGAATFELQPGSADLDVTLST
ncbi:MAG TPA: endo-1,4-beta-xylanase [Jiangellaceae bacterium]|nr:endo-1,4-beta-xylanase [Jiangellaceae bacterium]